MTSSVDTDKAWDDFVEERKFQKATSIQGQLDTITSMLSEIKTDTERAAAAASMPDEPAPMDMGVPMDMAGAEEMGAPDAGELQDVPEGTAPEGSGMPVNDVVDDTMPPAGLPEDMPPAEEGPVDTMPEEEVVTDTAVEDEAFDAGTPVESDLIGQIKVMIANTTDNEQLKGLSNLLSTALSQNQPASPMQGAETAEMNQTSLVKSADGKDEEKEEVEVEEKDDGDEEKEEVKEKSEEKSEGKDDDDKDDITIEVSEEPMPEESEPMPEADIGKDVAEAVADVVEEIVDAALEQPEAVVEMAEEVAEPEANEITEETESFETSEEPVMKSFADMFAARTRYGVDGRAGIVKADVGEQYAAPAEDDKAPQDVPTGSLEQAEDEDIITEINAESIGKSAAPSFAEMFKNRNAMMDFIKADVGQPKDADSLRSEGEMPTGDVSVPKDADDLRDEGEMPSGDVPVPKDADSLRKACDGKTDEESEETAKGLKKSGIHIKSFAEMYAGDRHFMKSTGGTADTSRPSNSAIGGTVDRPNLGAVKKSAEAEKPALQIGFGVDPHEAVKADWEKYYALRDQL